MIVGIDVGGTHTDGVLLTQGKVMKTSKVPTHRDNLDESILQVLDELLESEVLGNVKRIVFSTTLTTNLIAQKCYPVTGLVLIPGPGMPIDSLNLAEKNWIVSGSIDHRGRLKAPLSENELAQIIADLKESDIKDIAIVGKFSTRNPALEEKVERSVRDHLPEITNIQSGHKVALGLNFPRRIQTTWLNTAVHREYANFLYNVEKAVRIRGIQAQLYLLKADGGTMPLSEGLNHGVETIKSGPAASTLGFLALAPKEKRTALLLDIGGSTTDLALMTEGVPLFEPDGVQIENYLTAVRGLLNRSIPYGGDSPIILENGEVSLSPNRVGPALAFGGTTPTLTDALIITGLMAKGNVENVNANFFPTANIKQMVIAKSAIHAFYTQVETAVKELLEELNERPAYTIHELLSENKLEPEVLLVVGGPAESLLAGLAERLKLMPLLPEYHHVANALGAAVARRTLRHTLYADTAERFYTISGISGKKRITGRFTLADAREILRNHATNALLAMDSTAENAELVEITHEESFNIVRGFSTEGQLFKLEAQLKPGIDPTLGRINFSKKRGDLQ